MREQGNERGTESEINSGRQRQQISGGKKKGMNGRREGVGERQRGIKERVNILSSFILIVTQSLMFSHDAL